MYSSKSKLSIHLIDRKRRKDTELEDAIRLEPQVTPMTERKPLYYHEEVKQEIKGMRKI